MSDCQSGKAVLCVWADYTGVTMTRLVKRKIRGHYYGYQQTTEETYVGAWDSEFCRMFRVLEDLRKRPLKFDTDTGAVKS